MRIRVVVDQAEASLYDLRHRDDGWGVSAMHGSAQPPEALRIHRPAMIAPRRFAWPAAVLVGAGCAALALGAGAGPVPTSPDAARGEHIARLVCSACHVVAVDQEYPPLLIKPAPSFAEIAKRPGVSAETLQHFILSTHWDTDTLPMTMPSPMLSQDEARAVSRYILTLRSH